MCPDIENLPATIEGAQAWQILTAVSGHVRIVGMGRPIALDLPAAVALIPHSDGDPAVIRDLLIAAASGVGAALSEETEDDG